MGFSKFIHLTCSIALTTVSLSAAPPSIRLVSEQVALPMQNNQTLLDALAALGTPVDSIAQFHASGETSPALIAAFSRYASNSNEPTYNNLSFSESNSLILFGYMLASEEKISPSAMETLMADEKMRLQMPLSQIKELEDLSQMVQNDENFSLSDEQIAFVQSILPYINKNPFAFADVLGPLISAFLIDEDNEDNEDVDLEIHTALTRASQTVINLSNNQIQTSNHITNEYNNNQQFNSTTENVEAVNAVMPFAFLPFGLYALYPVIGSHDVYAVGNVTRVHARSFNPAYANRYHGQVQRNQRVDAQRRNHATGNRRAPDARRGREGRVDRGGERDSRMDRGGGRTRERSFDSSRRGSGRAERGGGNRGSRGSGGNRGGRGGRGGGGNRGGGGRR